jgi:hypothetical protein
LHELIFSLLRVARIDSEEDRNFLKWDLFSIRLARTLIAKNEIGGPLPMGLPAACSRTTDSAAAAVGRISSPRGSHPAGRSLGARLRSARCSSPAVLHARSPRCTRLGVCRGSTVDSEKRLEISWKSRAAGFGPGPWAPEGPRAARSNWSNLDRRVKRLAQNGLCSWLSGTPLRFTGGPAGALPAGPCPPIPSRVRSHTAPTRSVAAAPSWCRPPSSESAE